jgi:CubicO group peptidase (beta-lactamase class C family)
MRVLGPDAGEADHHRIDLAAIRAAVRAQAGRVTPGIDDLHSYMKSQTNDASHREIIGPMLPATGASGLVAHRGVVLATWGEYETPEMLFSGTKSLVSTVAGLAFDDGLLVPQAPVGVLPDPVTWHQLLQQTSQWTGELWGKPTSVDTQSRGAIGPVDGPPGTTWAYNDVRVNLLCLALTLLLRRPLPDVLAERVLGPIGASSSWSWHGYERATVDIDGVAVPVVSGGAHWGGGVWISAWDLALVGQLYLRGGQWGAHRVLSTQWISRTFEPCPVNPEYGYLWWLNDTRSVVPQAPATGRCARGNLGRHMLWIDPARDLVVVSRWGERVGELLGAVSAALPVW